MFLVQSILLVVQGIFLIVKSPFWLVQSLFLLVKIACFNHFLIFSCGSCLNRGGSLALAPWPGFEEPPSALNCVSGKAGHWMIATVRRVWVVIHG